jgi:hypothetical protein
MNQDTRTDPAGVPLELLRRYLLALGWRQAPNERSASISLPPEYKQFARELIEGRSGARRNFEAYLLSEPGVDDVELVLPRDRNASDFQSRMEGAIRTLSELERRPPEQIIADVRAVGFDVVESRIPEELVQDDTVLLEIAANYIAGIKGLLAATATTELDPVPYFLRVKKEATEYADGCHFGHTFRGSFGFTIESPVVRNVAPLLFDIEQTPPFERRVIQRLARGLSDITEAVQRDEPAIIVNHVNGGFSANACEQFANLVEETAHTGMSFAFSFSPEWPPAPDLIQKREFQVGPRHVEITRAAARSLRAQPMTREEQVVGRVVRLQSQADPSDLLTPTGEREVVIQWSSEDLGEILVRVRLTPHDYLTAIEAHRSGRPVSLKGTLEHKSRLWILSNPTEFSVPE